jgi:HEAT repeat protein
MTFEIRLQAIAQNSAPGLQSHLEQTIKQIRAVGISSYSSLLDAVSDRQLDPNIRASICDILGRWNNKRAIPTLLAVFEDPRSEVDILCETAKALGRLESKSAIKPLMEIVQSGKTPEARSFAAYTLGWLGYFLEDRRAVSTLIKQISDNTELPRVRGEVAEALANIGNQGLKPGQKNPAVQPLIAALSDPSAEVRFWAAFALGKIGDSRALPALRQLVKTDHTVLPNWWSVNKEAADAIKEINSLGCCPQDE